METEKTAKIKTAFIYNFTKYAYWPQEEKLKEFTICVINTPLIAQQLDNLTRMARFRDRIPIKVVSCRGAEDIKDCQMLVADGADGGDLAAIYSKIRGKSVLMVADHLLDYKKSMITFTIKNDRIRYVVNEVKLAEANLEIKKLLYDLAIGREGDAKAAIQKLNALLQNKDKEVKMERAELEKIAYMYNSLEKEKHDLDLIVVHMEDSMHVKLKQLNEKTEEYQKMTREIEKDRQTLYDQQRKISLQKKHLYSQGTKINQQRNVITLIGALAVIVLLFLAFAIRSNNQRKKANILLTQRKLEIEKQKHLVDEKQKEILDSINYAKRIQRALMANDKIMSSHLSQYFVLFKPKDIVAGDFYWAAALPDAFIYATGDSTGHGVPGAFMSLLNITKLNEAINQKHITRPDMVLNYVRENIISALNPEGSEEECKDGMDAILCKIDQRNMKLQYAAANSNFCIIRKREIINLRADKMPVGKSNEDHVPFTFNEVALEKGDMIYTFSDGYSDQFGGPKGKKFKSRVLRQVLAKISELPPEKQKIMLERQLEDWMGYQEQVDDVLIIGIRV